MAVINERIKELINQQRRQSSETNSLGPLPSFYPTQVIDYNTTTDGTPKTLEAGLADTLNQGAFRGAHGANRTFIDPLGETPAAINRHKMSTDLQQANGFHEAGVIIPFSALNSRVDQLFETIDQRRSKLNISYPTKSLRKPLPQISSNPNDQFKRTASTLARIEIELNEGKALLTRDRQQPVPDSPLLH